MPMFTALRTDLVFAARVLRKSPGFTLVAVASLALAIGANTAIFSVAKQLLFDRLAVADAASLRLLMSTDANFSYPIYEQLRAHNQGLGDLLAFHVTAVNATVGDNAERVIVHEVSGNYYAVLGVQPQLGRGIRPVDDTARQRSGGRDQRRVLGNASSRGRRRRSDNRSGSTMFRSRSSA